MNFGRTEHIIPYDVRPGLESFRAEVLRGLQKPQKELSPKYFYDERGSQLFERICALDEYYITRTETAIMEANIEKIVELMGSHVLLIEYGCGDCAKVNVLLDHMRDPVAYIPIDISREQLVHVTGKLTSMYPGLEILPVCADYTAVFELPVPSRVCDRRVVYFPGSTFGNFDPVSAERFLEHIAGVCKPGGALIIGVDIKKDIGVLNSAYNDKQGMTAAFNLNLLQRINSELNSDFKLDCFEHYAFYNPRKGRVEMHIVSQKEQAVHLDGVTISFYKGESIWTESSYKFNLDEFERMAAAVGFRVEWVWLDDRNWFSVQYLVAT